MSKALATTIQRRMAAGALVLVVREPDEALALASVRAGVESKHGKITLISPADGGEMLGALADLKEGAGVMVVPDCLLLYGENLQVVRMIREVALQDRDPGSRYSRLILIERPETIVPPALLGDVALVSSVLPTIADLQDELLDFADAQDYTIPGNGEETYRLAAACAGLPRHEARSLFNLCWIENKKKLDAGWLRAQKAKKVTDKLAGALTFEGGLNAEVGGMDLLKAWLKKRQAAFGSAKAKEFGLPEPKGVLLLGIPGCGKSLLAKVVAFLWSLPLLRLDVGKAMGSLVGQSEAQIRAALDAAEASAPCVLWVDEIEKGLAGAGGGGDSGTTMRVFGTLLTWLQEKSAPVFVVATANSIANLPPELLRKGRFDEIFFVGLPSADERTEILDVHLRKRGRESFAKAATAEVVAQCENFSGAEIEQAVIEGLFTAYADGERDLSAADVIGAIQATTPIATTMSDKIAELKKWAATRARPASSTTTTTTKGKSARRRRGPSLN